MASRSICRRAASQGREERMTPKEIVTARLLRTEVLEGVLPTPPERSKRLFTAARELRSNHIFKAVRSAASDLNRVLPNFGSEAISTFSGSAELREQLAGFADAGINLFHANSELFDMPLDQRSKKGANGMVSRVLVAEQRILLETPRMIVRFKEGMTEQQRGTILMRHQLAEIGGSGLPPDTVIASGDGSANALDQCLALMEEPDVVFSEPDFVEHIGSRYKPTGSEFAHQWHHQTIRSEFAWDASKGENVSIAVIDNGFDITHPDLKFGPLSALYQATPDHLDADFALGTKGMDDKNHGTACAGMLAAIERQDAGGCGALASSTSMIACMPDQVGSQSTLARAVAYAAAPDLEKVSGKKRSDGVDIICCSLGPNNAKWEIRQVMSDALDFAATQGRGGKGCVIFWACTNGNFPIGSDGICSHPHVLAVGRSGENDSDDGSGFGPQLEFLAPGVKVRIPSSGGGYQSITGTSFAAPCAAGVAALALSQHPELTAADLRQLMRDTCDKIGKLDYIGGRNPRFGYGRVNAERAVAEAKRRAAVA
jgi:thermitase